MITIPAEISTINGEDVASPATPIPSDAIQVVFNGTAYVVYFRGDVLPDEFL